MKKEGKIKLSIGAAANDLWQRWREEKDPP